MINGCYFRTRMHPRDYHARPWTCAYLQSNEYFGRNKSSDQQSWFEIELSSTLSIFTTTVTLLSSSSLTMSAMLTLSTEVFIVRCLMCGYQFSTFSDISSRRSCIHNVKNQTIVVTGSVALHLIWCWTLCYFSFVLLHWLVSTINILYSKYHQDLLILAVHVFDPFLLCVFEASLQCSDTILNTFTNAQ